MGGYDFPICLYDLDVYDGKDHQLGLLCSPLLVRVHEFGPVNCSSLKRCQFWKYIFTSPKSAYEDKPGQGAKSGQAKNNKMKKVTPGSIVYAATQVRYSTPKAQT